MSNNLKIEAFYDLLAVDFITDKEVLLKEMEHARQNKNAIDNYLLACTHKYAQLTKQKVFKHEVTYDISYDDYYVGSDKDKIMVGPDCLHSEVVDYGDGNWNDETLEEVADYSKED
jgi:hypothetical protein